MRHVYAIVSAVLMSAVALQGAQAAGCLSGAAVGGVAGHVAGHHGVLGAAAGCAVGHHMNVKQQNAAAASSNTPQK
jgi:hypothetical protein